MPGTRVFPRTLTNFDLLLQDIRTCLGESYVFYEECIAAITCAVARQEDASAWCDQLQQVVEGKDSLEISHAGVIFLLGELGEAPLINVTPRPLTHRNASRSAMNEVSAASALTANVAHVGIDQMPTKGPKTLVGDIFLFNDPMFRTQIEDFFGVKASTSAIRNHKNALQHPFNANASYCNVYDFMPPYKTTDDDLQIFRERAATT